MKKITANFIKELTARAGTQPRQRTNHNIHESPSDPIQRMFVAAKKDSYFRPHRHPGKWEFAIVLQGRFDILLFNDRGIVTERLAVGPGTDTIGFELPADAWHTWVPMAESSVFLEIKAGPYDPKTASEFVPWAPAEGTAPVSQFVDILRQAKIGDCVAQSKA